jgi:hypothetical protein
MAGSLKFTEIAKVIPKSHVQEELLAKFWTNIEFSRTISKENAEQVLNLMKTWKTSTA